MNSFWTFGPVRCAIGLAVIIASAAHAPAQSVDLKITDESSYQRAISAIRAAEHVRYDFANNQRPRIAGAVAGLLEFAARNPLATAAQLTAFVNVHAEALQAAAPGDPQLKRSANFVPALRFSTPLTGNTAFQGLDTDIGAAAAASLGLIVPDPFDFNSLQSRMVGFESTQGTQGLNIASAPGWFHLLVNGFLGRDSAGHPNAAITSVLRTFLENEGFEPFPDGVKDARFAPVEAGLAQLPASYAAYLAAITVQPGQEVPPVWSVITDQFQAFQSASDAQLAQLGDAVITGPSLLEGVDLAASPTILDELQEDLRQRRDIIVTPRTVLSASALLMAQSQDEIIRSRASDAEMVGALHAEGYDGWAIAAAGFKTLGGATAIAIGIATVATGAGAVVGAFMIVGGALLFLEGGSELVAAWNDEGAPSIAEMQMFDQIVALRQDVEQARQEMHARFDRIERQLNVIFEGMATGFNALGAQIGDLQDTADNIIRDVLINRASLERIEDALYGMAENLLYAGLADSANTYLHYRGFNGVDLPYAGAQSYLDAANKFFTFTVDTAQNTSLAGPLSSTLSVATADEMLNGASIGRNVNDLRVFPFNHLGLPRLSTSRIVAPAQWAQGAAAYTQLARENPWYFAYQHEQQILSGVPVADRKVERIVREGQKLVDTMAAGRNQALFDALFEGYSGALDDLKTVSDVQTLGPKGLSDAVTSVDPWGPPSQSVRNLAPKLTELLDNGGDHPLALAAPSTDFWGLFRSPLLETTVVLAAALNTETLPGGLTWGSVYWAVSDSTLLFWYYSPDGRFCLQRVLNLNFNPSSNQIQTAWNCPTSGLRGALLSGASLTGQSFSTCGSPTMITVLSDTTTEGTTAWQEQNIAPATGAMSQQRAVGGVAIDAGTLVLGAPGAGASPPRGEVYVYTLSSPRKWSLQATLFAGDGGPSDQFGFSVGISGDTVIVGAPKHNGSGAVYVFTREGEVWTQRAKIERPASTVDDQFGYAVSLEGKTAVIGAAFFDNASPLAVNAGMAWVYTGGGAMWMEQQALPRPGGAQAQARYASAVALRGDRVIIGSPFEDVGPAMDRGAAYIFAREGDQWTQQGPALFAADGAANHQFGWSVDIDADQAIVGAPGANNMGAVYTFIKNAGAQAWTQRSKVTAQVAGAGDRMGESVAIDGAWALAGARAFANNQGGAFFFASAFSGAAQFTLASNTGVGTGLGVRAAMDGPVAVVGGVTRPNPGQSPQIPAAYAFTIGSYFEPYTAYALRSLRQVVLGDLIDELDGPGGSGLVHDATGELSDWASLIRAYTTFSLPYAMEASNVLRAGLSGNPETGDLSLRGEAVLPVCEGLLTEALEPNSPFSVIHDRLQVARNEINGALDSAFQGYSYLNWMLNETRSLRDHVFDLAVDDMYATPRDTPLVVSAENGLKANDVDQACRVITVDSLFFLSPAYIAPQHGNIGVNADGSFTYTPNAGFSGADRFNYRIGTSVAGIGCQPGSVMRGTLDQYVYSNPANVVIIIRPPACPADISGDGVVNSSDLAQLLGAWGASQGPGDLDHNGQINSSDLALMLGGWGVCPG